MARAVIELTEDISPIMPQICRQIWGCAYNPEAHLASFNYHGILVYMEPRQILLFNAESEAEARNVLNWLKTLLKDGDASPKA